MVSIATVAKCPVMEASSSSRSAGHGHDQSEESDGEPFTARRAESLDASGVKKLLKRHTESVFGRVNVDNVM